MENRKVTVLNNLEELSRAAAAKFVELAQSGIAAKGSFTVALAGGSTPKKLYELLADENESFRAEVDWRKINFFWGDERCVAPDSDESNYRMANESLLKPLNISPSNIHRFKSESDAETAARDYERFLRFFFNEPNDGVPRFDLILLGMGADGHTASLFPNTDVLRETEKLVAAPFVEKFGTHRLTLTPNVINNASNVIFQVAGADKADALREVLDGEIQPETFPSQIVNLSSGKVYWFLDEAAAQHLSSNHKV
ncbi:MAG: 6-phosphogluconolactonase [Pyrinomonadaceae bacterium]|nr:6-phosphogluconolactonase [Pyrinomonadaceae bacterium]